jgi:hypothetical protein
MTCPDVIIGTRNAGTGTTEAVYRHRLKPVITGGAEVMDEILTTQSA